MIPFCLVKYCKAIGYSFMFPLFEASVDIENLYQIILTNVMQQN
jgi:hypothetical protein